MPSSGRCRNLRELRIPEGVTKIGAQALRNCSRITEIHVPAACIELGGNAFRCCDRLEYVISPRVGAGDAASLAGFTELTFAKTRIAAGIDPETNHCHSAAVISTPLAITKHGDIFRECPKLRHLRLETPRSRVQIMRLHFWDPSTHLQRCTASQREAVREVMMIAFRLVGLANTPTSLRCLPGELWAMILRNVRPRDLGPLGLE